MGLVKCPGCGTTISDVLDACPGCGYRLRNQLFKPIKMDSKAIPVRCPWCGETVPAGKTRCPGCGSPAKVTHSSAQKRPEPARSAQNDAPSRPVPETTGERKRVSRLLLFLLIIMLIAGILLGMRTLKWVQTFEAELAAMQPTAYVVTNVPIE